MSENISNKALQQCKQLLNTHPYPILVDEDIEGDTIETLEEWYSNPYKYEIMADALKFKQYLRTHTDFYIHNFVTEFERLVNGSKYHTTIIPDSLVNTNLGHKILNDIKTCNDILIQGNALCHNALYYKSFILKNNKLIGIKNWQYAGYYPPALEDIIHRYLEYI
ncbi:unnamed protein product [Cunninghamella echinulata]